MKKKAKRNVLGYLCGVAFQWELGETDVNLYGSKDSLKADHKCWKDCGIVELGVEDGKYEPKWIAKAKPFKANKKRQATKTK